MSILTPPSYVEEVQDHSSSLSITTDGGALEELKEVRLGLIRL